MRGQQALHTSVFPCAIEANPDNKGRRNVLLDKRDEALITRYYFHAEIKGLRYDRCLLELEKEFFITAGVITQRINLSLSVLKLLVNQRVTIQTLKKKYPFYSWDIPR